VKRVLVVGKTGQLATSIAEHRKAFPGLAVDFVGRPEIDLQHVEGAVASIGKRDFDVLVNASAYNDVDGAERDFAAAFAINAEGPAQLAALAAERGATFVHFSTDYVFAGGAAPYRESDEARPLGRYGESKLEGERRVAAANPRHFVFRTAWVFSPFARSFLRTLLQRAGEQDELRMVSDQRSNPTDALGLAEATLRLIEALQDDDRRFGLYHMAGEAAASRFELAEAIIDTSRRLGGPTCRLVPALTADFPTAATRPGDSRLDCGLLKQNFGLSVPGYRERLEPVIRRLLASG
jgi:dTDP-4-dehydrorhamnose reductase